MARQAWPGDSLKKSVSKQMASLVVPAAKTLEHARTHRHVREGYDKTYVPELWSENVCNVW